MITEHPQIWHIVKHLGFICIVILYSLGKSPAIIRAQVICDYTVGANEAYSNLEAVLTTGNDTAFAGKTICIRDNKTYSRIIINASGTSETRWLTIISHPQNLNKPIFTDSNPDGVIKIKGSYVQLEGLQIADAGGDAVVVVDTQQVKLDNLTVTNSVGSGIQVDNSSYVWIDRCQVSQAVTSTGSTVGENVQAKSSDHVWITNCLITEDGSARGGVLNSGQSTYTFFQHNELHLNNSNNLHLGNGEHVVFENNLVSAGCGKTGAGIYRQAERYPKDGASYQYKGNDLTFRNNLIVNMTKGINILGCQRKCRQGTDSDTCEKEEWIQAEECPFDNVTIENNTVVGTGIPESAEDEASEYALFLGPQQNHSVSNVQVRNNIFHSVVDGESDLENQMTGEVIFSGNLWSSISLVPSSDILITNWNQVFPQNPNLRACSNSRPNPNLYQVSSTYSGKGVDVANVGIKSTLTSIAGDFNNDGKVNLSDLDLVIAHFYTTYTLNDFNLVVSNYAP